VNDPEIFRGGRPRAATGSEAEAGCPLDGTNQVRLAGQQDRLAVVEHQAVDPLQQFQQPVPLAVDPKVHRVDEGASVMGVSVAGRHRAYLVHAFEGMSSHVVNDLVGETAISVTHCSLTRCTRVFTTDKRGAVIDLCLGGWENNKMSLRFNGVHYAQTSSDIPLADFPFEATTWRQWKAAHPDTDIYVGETDAPRP